MLRISKVMALPGFRLRLTLTDGQTIERDAAHLLAGPVFDGIRRDFVLFSKVRVEGGTVVWPNGADLCPDTLIWQGPPPLESATLPGRVSVDSVI